MRGGMLPPALSWFLRGGIRPLVSGGSHQLRSNRHFGQNPIFCLFGVAGRQTLCQGRVGDNTPGVRRLGSDRLAFGSRPPLTYRV
jgi:hypothetical protein